MYGCVKSVYLFVLSATLGTRLNGLGVHAKGRRCAVCSKTSMALEGFNVKKKKRTFAVCKDLDLLSQKHVLNDED